MTNGEKIKEIFPNIIKYGNILIDDTGTLQKNILFDDTWWNAEYKEPTPNNNLTVDCVSRQEVDRLARIYLKEPTDNHVAFYEDFLDLPSVIPIRPKGHWIEVLGGCKCSCCDMAFSRLKETCADNYCPNCGADMER